MMKRIYIDMDDTLCNFSGPYIDAKNIDKNQQYPQSKYGFFLNLKPLPDAVKAYKELEKHFDVYILTRPSYFNPSCYIEKRLWVEEYLGHDTCRKLIICYDKFLLKGDYLIDDNIHEGFDGVNIHFGSIEFPSWSKVLKYFLKTLENTVVD